MKNASEKAFYEPAPRARERFGVISIRELGEIVAETVGYRGKIVFDTSKPDGTPRKLCDTSLLRSLGWTPKIPLRAGVASAYRDFLRESASGSLRK